MTKVEEIRQLIIDAIEINIAAIEAMLAERKTLDRILDATLPVPVAGVDPDDDLIVLPEPDPAPPPPQVTPPGMWVRPKPKPLPEWAKVPANFTNTYYFHPDGDDANLGTKFLPKKTYNHAMSLLKAAPAGTAFLFARGEAFTATGTKFLGQKGNNGIDYVYQGAYGEGADPIVNVTGHFEFEKANGYYWHNINFQGAGYDNGTPECFRLWDNLQYFVFNNVTTDEFGLGFNISQGRRQPETYNTHIAIFNSQGKWNSTSFIYGAFVRHTFIDNNVGEYNGGDGRGHNFYLAGHWDCETSDYVFQRNISRHCAPRLGKAGGGRSRGGIVAHGYIADLFYVDNLDEEEKGTSEPGGWGQAIDEGSPPNWGDENFPRLISTGNIAKYTGNVCFSYTNCDNALIGWNEAWLEPKYDSVGFAIPGKNSEDPATKIKTITFVHNKVYMEGAGPNGTAIAYRINIDNLIEEHNEVIQ